jgi:hypothetical protein
MYLVSCTSGKSKDEITPVLGNIEEIIVGKTWKLLDIDYGWVHLNTNNTYLTKDYLCDTLEQSGTWELDENVLVFTYIIAPIEYIERHTIIELSDTLIKIQSDTSATLDVNILFELVPHDVIRGCMDSTFLNFNPNAQCPDTCMNDPIYGCMDPYALNYDTSANIDDGSCCYVGGCMDATALNYNANACQDDGSCCFVAGCMDNTALNYNANACQDDGSCCFVAGCMDATALNYNANACQDDGSCDYTLNIGDFLFGGVVFWIDNSGEHGLVCDIQTYTAHWGCHGTFIAAVAFTDVIGQGSNNTTIILNVCSEPNIAARQCVNSTAQGYSDWFLPNLGELEQIYLNKTTLDATILSNGGNQISGRYWASQDYGCNSGNHYADIFDMDIGGNVCNNCEDKNSIQSFIAVRAF